jgi:hypothetical protein
MCKPRHVAVPQINRSSGCREIVLVSWAAQLLGERTVAVDCRSGRNLELAARAFLGPSRPALAARVSIASPLFRPSETRLVSGGWSGLVWSYGMGSRIRIRIHSYPYPVAVTAILTDEPKRPNNQTSGHRPTFKTEQRRTLPCSLSLQPTAKCNADCNARR